MSRLEIRLLGTPEVWRDGQLLTFPTRKVLALLIYLAVSGGRHSREKLITLLWPESDTPRGQASLRNTLLRLRQALGRAEQYLVIEGDWLALDLGQAGWLDWQTVMAAAKTSEIGPLQAAVDHYRGDFLEGFSLPDAPAFDEWVTAQREHGHRQMGELLAQLSRLQMDAADIADGLATAMRWTTHDPLDEAAHRRLMELHLMAGDKAAALQAYERCRALLASELDLEPAPETQALAERATTWPADRVTEASTHPHTPSPVMRSIAHPLTPFVGRSVKHLQLVTAFHTARQTGARVVVVEGEAGIGKTRLATEFLRWAAAHGADGLLGRALATGGRLSYQPLVDALRPRLEQENAPEDLLGDVWLAELSRLLPELHERYPDLTPLAGDEASARVRLLEAVTRLGQALAQRKQPLILCLDDLQWADAATLDVLHYCGRAWAQNHTPILLLFTLRDEELAASPELTTWLADLGRDLPLQRLSLAPLTAADTVHLVQILAGQSASDQMNKTFAGWLFGETAGQPFFIAETLKELVTQGALRWRSHRPGEWILEIGDVTSWQPGLPLKPLLPAGVQQLIQARLARLAPATIALLRASAVLGRAASYSRLCQVAGLDEAEGLAALDELVNGRLLLESGPAPRPYTIAHDKIREVVYAETGAARRQLLHHRALSALEAAAGPAAELAHHALAAHLPEPAFRYSVMAGDAAIALFAVRDAIAHYQQAQALNQQEITDEENLRPRFYLGLGRAYELAGELKKAEQVYLEMRDLAETQQEPDLICVALNHLATVAVHRYEFDAAAAYLQEALQAAEKSGQKALLAETLWSRSQLAHHLFDFQASAIHSQRVLSLARELDNHELIAGSLNSLAYAHMLSGNVIVGLQEMEEARQHYTVLGNLALQADCLTAIAAAHIWLGQTQAGIEAARAAEAICASVANPWGHIYSRVWLATGLLDRGEYAAALAVAQAGQQQAEAYQLPPMHIFINLVLGKVYQALQQPDNAFAAHAVAARLNEQAGSDAFAALIAAELCTDCVLAGQWAEAVGHARQAVALRRYTALPLVIPARWPETAALLWAGDTELARDDVRRWGEQVGHIPRFCLPHLRALAVLAEEEGDAMQAINHLAQALSLAETLNLPGEQWPLLARLAHLYPDAAQAAEARQRAVAIVNHLAQQLENEKAKTHFTTAAFNDIAYVPLA